MADGKEYAVLQYCLRQFFLQVYVFKGWILQIPVLVGAYIIRKTYPPNAMKLRAAVKAVRWYVSQEIAMNIYKDYHTNIKIKLP